MRSSRPGSASEEAARGAVSEGDVEDRHAALAARSFRAVDAAMLSSASGSATSPSMVTPGGDCMNSSGRRSKKVSPRLTSVERQCGDRQDRLAELLGGRRWPSASWSSSVSPSAAPTIWPSRVCAERFRRTVEMNRIALPVPSNGRPVRRFADPDARPSARGDDAGDTEDVAAAPRGDGEITSRCWDRFSRRPFGRLARAHRGPGRSGRNGCGSCADEVFSATGRRRRGLLVDDAGLRCRVHYGRRSARGEDAPSSGGRSRP